MWFTGGFRAKEVAEPSFGPRDFAWIVARDARLVSSEAGDEHTFGLNVRTITRDNLCM